MKKIVVIPLGRVEDYINTGKTYQYFEKAFNPDDYFDEVYCLSYGGKECKTGKVQYINARPADFGKIIRRIKPDIVRAYAGCEPCDWAVANRVQDIPIVVSVHDVNPDLLNRSLKYADYIICKSEIVKEDVKKYVDVDEKRIFVLPNRVDTNVFKKRDSKEFEKLNEVYGNGKHILHVGRKVEQKNLETLIQALQYLPLEYKAIFVGPGNADFYNQLARECNVSERCFFIDHVSREEELPIYYSWCDCMCTPSRWEGFGFVFIEAAACECPIVTSNIAPMNEYLTNGIDSILVDEYENPEILAKCIIQACDQNEEIQRMKNNARKVGLRFDRAAVDKEESELYKKLILMGADNTQSYRLEGEREKIKKKIIIFGAGKVGKSLLNCVEREKIAYFVDNDSQKVGQKIDGIEIIGYADLLKIHSEYNVVVTPVNRREIVKKLLADGIEYMEVKWYLLLKEQSDKNIDTNTGKE